jgi:hypothetical protein
MDVLEIKNKVLNKMPVSVDERVFLISNDAESLGAFMVANNIGSVNLSLRKLGYKTDFEPKVENVVRQLQIIIDQKHEQDFNYILDNYKIDLDKISIEDKEFLQKLIQTFNNK